MALNRRSRAAQAGAVAFAGIILSIAAYNGARLAEHDRVLGALELHAERRARDIERRLAVAGGSAEALAIYLAADGEVTAAQFHNFAQLAHDQADADSALYWAPWVDGANRPAFVIAARRDVDRGYDIRDAGPNESFASAAERAAYLPVLFAASFDHASGVSGYDLLPQPDREALIERVRDTGRPAIAAPLPPLMGDEPAPALIILWPVYKNGAVPPTVEARGPAFRGIAAARFRLDRVLSGPTADELIGAIDIAAGSDVTTARPVASYDAARRRVTPGGRTAPTAPDGLTIERDFTVLDQYWMLRLHFPPAAIAALTSSAPSAWPGIGLSITAMMVVFVLLQSARLGEAEVTASETDDRFRLLFDENPIGMVLATASGR